MLFTSLLVMRAFSFKKNRPLHSGVRIDPIIYLTCALCTVLGSRQLFFAYRVARAVQNRYPRTRRLQKRTSLASRDLVRRTPYRACLGRCASVGLGSLMLCDLKAAGTLFLFQDFVFSNYYDL